MAEQQQGRRAWVGVAVILVLAIGIGVYAAVRDTDTPISSQSCSELVETLDQAQTTRTSPDSTADESRDAMHEASEVYQRVDDLGGCPEEPSLQ